MFYVFFLIFSTNGLLMSHLRLNSRQSDDTNNILPVAAAGEVIDRSCKSLQHRAVSFCFSKSLNQLVTDVAAVKVREDKNVSMTCNFASFCFCFSSFV